MRRIRIEKDGQVYTLRSLYGTDVIPAPWSTPECPITVYAVTDVLDHDRILSAWDTREEMEAETIRLATAG